MENNAHVFRIMIASPGDTNQERQVIENIIYKLNTFYSRNDIFLFPCMWEKDVPAGFYQGDIQNTIDEYVTHTSDMVIGIFKDTLGRQKGSHELFTYTVGEIRDHVQRGKQGIIIFIDHENTNASKENIEKVRQLRQNLESLIGTNAMYLKYTSATDLSINFPEKLRQSIDEMIIKENNKAAKFRSQVSNNFTFFENVTLSDANDYADNYRTFQTIPYFAGGKKRETIEKVVSYSLSKLKEYYSPEQGYWTAKSDDTEFNRVYYTSSVLTYLFQLGINQDDEMIQKPLNYLKSCSPSDINLRAGTFFLIAFHLIDQSDVCEFIQALIDYDYNERGVMLLPQQDTKTSIDEHWDLPTHKDGSSFHACHISDYLLHMDDSFTTAKAQAEPLLLSLKRYILEEFKNNSGFLTDKKRKPSTITLYGYAISAALGITLPDNWLENVKVCKEELLKIKKDNFKRCLGVLNFSYMSRMSDNPDLKKIANDYIQTELSYLWKNRDAICDTANNTAIWARAFIYGHDSLSTSSSYYFKEFATQEVNNGK